MSNRKAKISSGIAKSLNRDSVRVDGNILFGYIMDKGLNVDDEILNSIISDKTLGFQPDNVIDYFGEIFKGEAVTEDSAKKKLHGAVESLLKKHSLSFNGLSPAVLHFVSARNGKTFDLSIFKTPLKKWSDEDYKKAYSSAFGGS